jgi:hypothetical protein
MGFSSKCSEKPHPSSRRGKERSQQAALLVGNAASHTSIVYNVRRGYQACISRFYPTPGQEAILARTLGLRAYRQDHAFEGARVDLPECGAIHDRDNAARNVLAAGTGGVSPWRNCKSCVHVNVHCLDSVKWESPSFRQGRHQSCLSIFGNAPCGPGHVCHT